MTFKIVFYGPGLGGKTTTLQHIHDVSQPERRGKMVSLATAVDRTLYFDFLPLRLPPVAGMQVRLQLFTVPGQVYYNATRKLVLNGADGIVFVADSQEARGDANLESLENLRENLAEQNRSLFTVPHVFQLNKRDLPGVLTEEELNEALNTHHAPSLGSVATSGEGVFETLDAITRAVVESFQRSRSVLPPASSPSAPAFGKLNDQSLISALRSADRAPGAAAERTIAVVSTNVLEAARDRPSDAIAGLVSLSTPPVLTDADEVSEPPTPIVPDAGALGLAPSPPTCSREAMCSMRSSGRWRTLNRQ
ncbi:MAG: ADP-ribosylation factor-like protein [Polyangiaceae bacterium]